MFSIKFKQVVFHMKSFLVEIEQEHFLFFNSGGGALKAKKAAF